MINQYEGALPKKGVWTVWQFKGELYKKDRDGVFEGGWYPNARCIQLLLKNSPCHPNPAKNVKNKLQALLENGTHLGAPTAFIWVQLMHPKKSPIKFHPFKCHNPTQKRIPLNARLNSHYKEVKKTKMKILKGN